MLVIDRIRSEAYFVPQLDISIGPSLAWLRTVKASILENTRDSDALEHLINWTKFA